MSSEEGKQTEDIAAQVTSVLGKAFPGVPMVVIIFNPEKPTCDLVISADVGARNAAEAMAEIGGKMLSALNKSKPTVN